jgi:hemin uptake protein HemP
VERVTRVFSICSGRPIAFSDSLAFIPACRDRPVTDHELRTTSLGRIAAPLRPRVSSHDLFRGGREVVIVHGRREYLLRITRTDKLILTK